MINLSSNELKLTAKSRSIKDYEKKSEDDLTKILNKPKTKNKPFQIKNKRDEKRF